MTTPIQFKFAGSNQLHEVDVPTSSLKALRLHQAIKKYQHELSSRNTISDKVTVYKSPKDAEKKSKALGDQDAVSNSTIYVVVYGESSKTKRSDEDGEEPNKSIKKEDTLVKQFAVPAYTRRAAKKMKHLTVYDVPSKSLVVPKLWFAVRAEYELIFNRLKEITLRQDNRARALLIVGNSGIGKSVALDDMLRRVLDKDFAVVQYLLILVITEAGNYIFFRQTATKAWSGFFIKRVHSDVTSDYIDSMMKPVKGANADKRILVLHDVKSTKRGELKFDTPLCSYLRDNYCLTIVVASSPNDDNHRSFEDSFEGRKYFYSRCWDAEEAQELWMLNDRTKDTFEEAFYSIGGVPRHLLNETSQDFIDKVRGKMETLLFEEFSKSLHQDNPHHIAKLEPNGNRSSFIGYTFISKGVEDMWYAKQKSVDVAELRRQYDRCVEEALPRGAQGVFYERYVRACLASISKNTPLQLFSLDKKKKTLEDTSARVPVVRTFSGDNASAVVETKSSTLYVPRIDNFPFVDFLIVNKKSVTLIQVTVKHSHKPTMTTVRKILDPLKTNGLKVAKLVWVCPPGEGISKWQPMETAKKNIDKKMVDEYEKIPQYLCVLPKGT